MWDTGFRIIECNMMAVRGVGYITHVRCLVGIQLNVCFCPNRYGEIGRICSIISGLNKPVGALPRGGTSRRHPTPYNVHGIMCILL